MKRSAIYEYKLARNYFRNIGISFPLIPISLYFRLRQVGRQIYSSRSIPVTPYDFQFYINELNQFAAEDYILLSHTGFGSNAYAIQFYLVYRNLSLMLHLPYGGTGMDNLRAAERINSCFDLAEMILESWLFRKNDRDTDYLQIVGSELQQNYCIFNGRKYMELSPESLLFTAHRRLQSP